MVQTETASKRDFVKELVQEAVFLSKLEGELRLSKTEELHDSREASFMGTLGKTTVDSEGVKSFAVKTKFDANYRRDNKKHWVIIVIKGDCQQCRYVVSFEDQNAEGMPQLLDFSIVKYHGTIPVQTSKGSRPLTS